MGAGRTLALTFLRVDIPVGEMKLVPVRRSRGVRTLQAVRVLCDRCILAFVSSTGGGQRWICGSWDCVSPLPPVAPPTELFPRLLVTLVRLKPFLLLGHAPP